MGCGKRRKSVTTLGRTTTSRKPMQAVMRIFGPLAMILAGISANAQTIQEIKVEVPFNFTAAGKDLPAGEYHLVFNP
jgi:hypothetical protein